MTKPVGSTSNRANADYRADKPLLDIDLGAMPTTATAIIGDLSAYAGKYSGWHVRGMEIVYAGVATAQQIGFAWASDAAAAQAATQDVGVFGRMNTSNGASGLISGSGTGPITVAGAPNMFVSTATSPTVSFDFFISGIRGGNPSFMWQSAYLTSSGPSAAGNGGGMFWAPQNCSFFQFGHRIAIATGQQFSRGHIQVYGIP